MTEHEAAVFVHRALLEMGRTGLDEGGYAQALEALAERYGPWTLETFVACFQAALCAAFAAHVLLARLAGQDPQAYLEGLVRVVERDRDQPVH